MTKQVYKYDSNGYYTGNDTAFESPLEPGIFLIPANCTEAEPLKIKEGYLVKWNGTKWEYGEIPQPEPELEHVPTLEEFKSVKLAAIKAKLSETDYKQAKFIDGALTAEEYEPIKIKRASWRSAFNAVQVAANIEEIDAILAEVTE